MSIVRSICFALAASACVSSYASAADMMLPPPAPIGTQERIEFGTGWYLRGDISWAREKTPAIFADPNLGSGVKVQNGYSLTVGGGYKFNSWFRADLTYDYMRPTSLNQRSSNFTCFDNGGLPPAPISCYAQQLGTISRHVFLANGYLDVGSWSGLTPYVGAGVGMVYGKIASGSLNWLKTADNSPVNPVFNPGAPVNGSAARAGREYNLAWALMAGLSYQVSPNASIDMGYRFMNLGKFGAGSRTASVNEFRMGMRYMID